MSNDSRENLQGTDGQDVADLTAAAGQAVAEPTAAAAVDAAVEGATASSTTGAQDEAVLTDAQQPQNSPYAHSPRSGAQAPQYSPQPPAPRRTQSKVMVAPVPVHVPATEPRPWYRSRRSFAAKGGGGKVLVAGLGLTYTDHATGALLLANVDMGFRARTLSAILDPTGRRARALFLILAGLEEPQAGRIIAAPSRSWVARLAGRIGSVALIRMDSPLDETLTIRQNILEPLSATGSIADWDNLVGSLQVTGLAQRVDRYPSELTPWERFKALIARAIVSGAEVFLIEDPISLPDEARTEFEPLLRSLTKAGCAVVVSTPSPELAASTDRAILLTNGRVSLDAPNPTPVIIATSLEANPEDQSTLRASLPSPFDEVVAGTSGSLPSSAPVRRSIGAATNAQDLSFDEVPVDEPVLIAPVETNAGSVDNAPLRDIPAVDSEDPAQAEDEVSELVVRARKILSDLPGPIAPKE
ncbi:ATP-binding cassette domain-containing protein [uncultured Actinomyces sp.]|uniref:ATP-binding cassette domain-containing protein n=1 Tax=uncultured Actinomyces sp. TaxID=249061 RepID=UPI0028D61C5C|nr:ATP-binding cassette domain-containing protein [uncultured Actinomyces sp.]